MTCRAEVFPPQPFLYTLQTDTKRVSHYFTFLRELQHFVIFCFPFCIIDCVQCVCYLFVEGVCALQLCGAAGSLTQVVMTDQTHAVRIALQHKRSTLVLSLHVCHRWLYH